MRDILFQKKDFKTSLIHNGYKKMKNISDKWISQKYDKNFILKHLLMMQNKTIMDMTNNLLTSKAHLLKINGEFNNKLIDDFVHKQEENFKDECYKRFIESLKQMAEKMKKK